MGELIYGSDESIEPEIGPSLRAFDTIRELGGVSLRLLARIDARHLNLLTDKTPSPSEVWMALKAERGDSLPPDALAV